MKKNLVKFLYGLQLLLVLISTKIAYDWVNAAKTDFEPKTVFLGLAILLIGLIIRIISNKKEVNMKCPYDSERLHTNQNNIINITLENLKNIFFKEEKKDLSKKILLEKMGDKVRRLPVIMLTKKAVNISRIISSNVDTNEINNVFINVLENKCERRIWNNDTYRLMTLDEESNNLILGKSDYYKTLSTCDIHYYNFMNDNNSMISCKGKEYDTWFQNLKNIVLYNQFTTVSASIGCSTLLVIKNYQENRFQYYIVDNSRAKNPADTKHVVPSFMFQPTKKVTNIDDFQLQSNIQTQILKEFGEELLGMEELEKVDNQRELELIMEKNKDLERIKKLLDNGKATLKVLGVSLDIFRLRPELLTVLVIDDEKFYNNFRPKTSWEVSSKDKNGLGIYNIEDEEQYLKLIFDEKNPLVSPATACLKLGREYVLSHYYN